MAYGNLPARAFWLLLPALLYGAPSGAVQVTEHLDIGGALRARIDRDPSRDINEAGIDTFMLSFKYHNDGWTAAARYRWYGKAYPYQYVRTGGVRFAEYAWVGYEFDKARQLQLGLNQVPFGLQPLFSSSFYETLGNVVGLEDLQQVGAKYIQQSGDWNLQLGYYIKPAWPGHGTSNGSTYSIVITPADDPANGSRNQERGTAVARLARQLDLGAWKSEIGVSVYRSLLRNLDSGGQGTRRAYALHYQGQHGPWGVKWQFARQLMTPRNPDGSQIVTVGGYDGTFNLASRGNLHLLDLSYTFPGSTAHGWITQVRPYITYSRFDKSARGFKSSQRLFFGSSFSLKSLYIAVEWMHGKNDPYIGGSSYTQSLAAGGFNTWKSQLYVNIGYYF